MRVLITGGNRGIGAALTRAYEARGDQVIATARDGSTGHALDVTDPAAVVALAKAQDAPLDLLVCNAGVYLDKGDALGDGFAPRDWAASFAVNVTGVFLCAEAFLPVLERAKSPKIAVIASQMGSSTKAKGNALIYRASKAAAVNLALNLSTLLAPRGVAVGAYHPGWVRTDMGGAEADISESEAAEGLMARFDTLSLRSSGVFEAYDGRAIPI